MFPGRKSIHVPTGDRGEPACCGYDADSWPQPVPAPGPSIGQNMPCGDSDVPLDAVAAQVRMTHRVRAKQR